MLKISFAKELCEFLGTATLCFLVIGIPRFAASPITPFEGSLFAGAIVMLIIYAIGTISGAHINPAVSFGFLLSQRFSSSQFFRFVAAQVLGGIAALILLTLAIGKSVDWVAVVPRINTPVTFFVEAFLAGLLIFVIFSVATNDCRVCPDARPIAGVVIGVLIAALSFFGGTLGVGILNPAVLLVLTVLSGSWTNLLLYLIAAVIGTSVSVFLYRTIHAQ